MHNKTCKTLNFEQIMGRPILDFKDKLIKTKQNKNKTKIKTKTN